MKKWIIWVLSALTMALTICPTASGEEVETRDMQRSVVRNIELESDDLGDIVTILFSGHVPEIIPFTLTSPDRIVVDLDECILSKDAMQPEAGSGIVKAIRVGQHPDKVRIVLDTETLTGIGFDATENKGVVTIHISRPKNEIQESFQASEHSPVPANAPTLPGNNEEETAASEDIWGEDTDTYPENNRDDIWGEAPPATNENVRASDLWDQETSDMAGAESAKGLWDSADSSPGADSTPPPFELSGRFRTLLAMDTNNEDEFEDDGYGHAELLLESTFKPNTRLQMVFSLDIDYYGYVNSGDVDNDFNVRFHDVYINYAHPRFNLKLGNQVVRWGKADGYSPLDNLNPEDYRDGIAGRREDRKLPIPMANLEIYHGQITFQGIFIPGFFGPELDFTGTDWAMFRHADSTIGSFGLAEDDPGCSLDNSEYGIRVAGILKNIDYAVSWFHTREDLPTPDSMWLPPGVVLPSGEFSPIDLALFASVSGQNISLVHDRQNIFGFEIETTVKDFGVRADIAYFDNQSFQTSRLERMQKAQWQYMLGMDYNSPNAWYANLQFFQSSVRDYDPLIVWAEEQTSALIGTFRKTFSNGNYEIECRGYYDFSGDATMINPKFTIAYWQPLRLEFGAEFFDGSVETPIGFYSDNDQVYGLLEMNF